MKHLLLALLIVYVSITSVGAETLYATPEKGIACKFAPDQELPCFTLSQYASNASHFTSNTTLVLLPGNHVLDSNPLFITNITLLEVLASSANDTQISCNNSSGFTFENIGTVHIRGLSFLECDRNKVMFVESLLIEDSTFSGRRGSSSGLDLVVVTYANITTCSFVSNIGTEEQVPFTHPSSRFSVGGAMYINNSVVKVWNSVFHNNSAQFGGAVYIVNGYLMLYNSEFSSNSAESSLATASNGVDMLSDSEVSHGGAVYNVQNSSIEITNGNLFTGNMADSGGAVFNAQSSFLSVVGDNVFTDNIANYGGALFNAQSSMINLVENNTFSSNTAIVDGGAIFNNQSSAITIEDGNVFTNNKAEFGGVLYNDQNSTVTIVGGNIFNANEANNGGAAFNTHGSIITVVQNNTFTENRAKYGGALHNYETSIMNITDRNTFNSNTASDCGGAVISTKNSTLTVRRNNIFSSNEAKCVGGALYVTSSSTTLVVDHNTFTNNAAPYGGAVFSSHNCEIVIMYKNRFTDNTASGEGGAVLSYDSSITRIIGSNTFTNNSAPYGGVMYNSVNSTVSITDDNIFNENRAEDGGVVLNDRGSTLKIHGNNMFTNNVANRSGAVVVIRESEGIVTSSNTFTQNNASNGHGGAFFCDASSSIAIEGGNMISNNSAYIGGGAMYNEGVTMIITNNTIANNMVHTGNGGAIYNSGLLKITGDNTLISNVVPEEGTGGALYASQYSISTITDKNMFICNKAFDGGALYNDGDATVNKSNIFVSNTAQSNGGAIYNRKNLTITNDNTLIANSASNNGGAVYSVSSNLSISDSNELKSNVAQGDGGAVWTQTSTVVVSDNNVFTNNTAMMNGGSMVFRSNALTILTQKNVFLQNRAMRDGGAIVVEKSNLTLSENNAFINNTAVSDGGAIMAVILSVLTINQTCSFTANEAEDGGAIYLSTNSESTTTTNSEVTFIDNQAHQHGGGIYLSDYSEMHFHGHVYVTSNIAPSGGGVYVHSSDINIMGNIYMSHNRADSNGGGISSVNSNVKLLRGTLRLIENSAVTFGGGICLAKSSILYSDLEFKSILAQRNTGSNEYIRRVSFVNNTADYGGAVYVNDSSIPEACAKTASSRMAIAKCFLQVPTPIQTRSPSESFNDPSVIQQNHLYFSNNSAEVAGPALYGGLLDRCTLNIGTYNDTMEPAQASTREHYSYPYNAIEHIMQISNITEEEIRTLFASEAIRVCFCSNNQPDCSHQPRPIYIFKGRKIKLSVVAVDQVNNSVPAIIHASLASTESGSIFGRQLAQNVSETCNDIEYNITSLQNSETVLLFADGPCQDEGMSLRQIQVNFIPCTCPVGFQPSSSQVSCECECHRDLPYVTTCSSDTGKLERRGDFWIGVSNETESDLNETTFISVPFCPYDYCHPATESVLVNLNDPNGSDAQCAFNRSGKVCGSCKDGLSLVFGSSRCKPCSNHYLALLVPFSIAGIVLVSVLIVCNLTVAVGTINGLIFYANVVVANRVVFFPHGATSFLTVAISWISLNLGIETCFYDGMNAYSKMWLQIAFDIYLIVLVICIITACKYTNTFARLLYGKNPVGTLATLILLSYEKLSQKLFSLLAFATVDHTDGSQEGVWLFDPNLPYLRGKHIALLIMFIVTFIFGCAFNGLLLFGQCLPHLPRQKIFQWVRNTKFSAFLDAYQTPYNPKHRYWVGLLLLVRVILYLILEVNAAGDARINLLSVISVGVGLLLLKFFMRGRIYKTHALDMLETTFIVNLIMFAAVTQHVRETKGNQLPIAYTSFTIVLVTFIGILTYHTYTYALKYTNTQKRIEKWTKRTQQFFRTQFCNKQYGDKYGKKVVRRLQEPLNLITHAPTTGEYRLAELNTPPNHQPTVTCTEVEIPPCYAIPLTQLMGHNKSPVAVSDKTVVINTATANPSPHAEHGNALDQAGTQAMPTTL